MRSRAREALDLMRKHFTLADTDQDERDVRWHLQQARTFALVFLAESVASQYGDELRERFSREDDDDEEPA